MKQQPKTAKSSASRAKSLYGRVSFKTHPVLGLVNHFLFVVIVAVYILTTPDLSPTKTYASGNHDFVRTISKNITPDIGAPFSIGEVSSMVADDDGFVYAGYGTTIYKLSSSGAYIQQWEANGTIGTLNFDQAANVLYKTGDNGIQSFSANGVEITTIAVNGSLVRGGGLSPKWYGIGTSLGPVTDLNSIVCDYLFVYQEDGTLLESYDLNSYSWPEGVPILSISSYYLAGVVDTLYLGGPGRISSISPIGNERQVWEDGTGTTAYDSIDADHRGNIYVSDDSGDVVRKFDKDLQPLMDWGGLGSGDLNFDNPGEIAVSGSGSVYIDDVGNSAIKQYNDTLSISITSPDTIPGYIRPNTYFSYTVQTDNVSDVLSFSNIDGSGNPADLPLGLNLNTTTGEIYGTLDPSIELTDFFASFYVKVISSNGSFSEKYISLNGLDLSGVINIETTTLPVMPFGFSLDGQFGEPEYPSIQISGGHEYGTFPVEYSIVAGQLPSGVILDPLGGSIYVGTNNEGNLRGRPTVSGEFTFTVRAESSDPLVPSFDEQEYTVEVLAPDEPVEFAYDGINIPIVEVSSATTSASGTSILGNGPIDQYIKIYVDGEEIATVRSGQDGVWSYEAVGLNGSGRSFSAGWEASADIAFLLGNDTSALQINPDGFFSSVQIFDTDSGKTVKNLVMPQGIHATDVIPNSSSTKLYISAIDLGNFSGNSHNAKILEYDVATGSLNFVADITESLDSIANLLLSSDDSSLYALNSSGLYVINTDTYEKELVSRIDLGEVGMGELLTVNMELSGAEDTMYIVDLDESNIESSGRYIKKTIVVDLASGISSKEESFILYGQWESLHGRSFVAQGNGKIYIAHRDGTVAVLNESDSTTNLLSFNLVQTDYILGGTYFEDLVYGHFYNYVEDALYAMVVNVEDPQSGPYVFDFSLRKLDLDSGIVTETYQLSFLPKTALFSRDGSKLYMFDDASSPLKSGTYELDVATGIVTTLDETIDLQALTVANGGSIFKSLFFVPTLRNIASNFSVISPAITGEVGEIEEIIVEEIPEEEVVVEPEEETVSSEIVSEVGFDNQGPGEVGNLMNNTPKSDNKDVGLIRGLVNDLADALGVSPMFIAKVFPWAIIAALFGIIIAVLLSLIKQLIVVSKMKKLVRRQELLNLEKSWLLSLSSHYLRTPLTIIQSGQEMLLSNGEANKSKIVKGMSGLNITVSRVIDDLRNDSIVAEMQAPENSRYKHASFWQPKVVIPAVSAIGLVVLLNLVFTFGAELYPGTINILSQIGMAIFGVALLYIAYDTWAEKQALEKYQHQLLIYEERLDKVRNRFVLSIAKDLMPEIERAKSFITTEVPLRARRNLKKGLEQLERTTAKFLLICQLEREELKKQAAELGLKDTVEKAKEQSKHPKSPVKLLLSEESTLSQPEVLLKKVFASLIDNAAEHSDSKKPVKIYSDEGDTIKVTVEDYGKGIEDDKLSLLFKPLSKVEEDFTSQGIGLSLYLNRLIMHYLNGEITATSRVGVGTKMMVEIPRELA